MNTLTALIVFALLAPPFLRLRRTSGRTLLTTLFYLYACALVAVTILPIPLWHGLQLSSHVSPNFHPFIDLQTGSLTALRGVVLNVILFMPLGFLLVVCAGQKSLLRCVLLCFCCSFAIECIQLSYWVLFSYTYRIFDVTDLITNTLGGLLGGTAGYLLLWLAAPRKQKSQRGTRALP